jgi:hypothetical protein
LLITRPTPAPRCSRLLCLGSCEITRPFLMKIVDKIKSLFQTQPPSDEELAARAEAESERERIRTDFGTERNPTQIPPP